MANVNWIKIKNEYISTDISQRKLAEKYGISFNTLKAKANKEKWNDEKKKQYHNITTKVQQKTVEKIVEDGVNRVADITRICDKISEKLERAVDLLDDDNIDTHKLRQVTQCAKDLREMMKADINENDVNKLDDVLDRIEGNI